MTDPGPGGHGDLDSADLRTVDLDGVDLAELRRTSPRRAARVEAELHRRATEGEEPVREAFHEPLHEPVDEPVHEPVEPSVHGEPYEQPYEQPHGGPYEQPHAEPYEQPHDHPYDQHHDGDVQPQAAPVVHPWDEPDYDHTFGDPVADGYVPAEVEPVPTRRGLRSALRLVLMTVVVGAVGVAGWFAWQQVSPVLDQVGDVELFAGAEDFEGPGEGAVEVVVEPGETGREMGQSLVDAGVVASVEAFVAAANAEPDFTAVQPGTYTLPQGIPATDAVAGLLDPANRAREDTVVFAEGLRVEQVLDRLAEQTGADRDELEAALDEVELPAAAPAPEDVLVHPAEGFLYPDGYQFGDDATPVEMLQTMVDRGQEVLAEVGVPPEEQLRVLTEASLIQGEARLDEDFGRVAQVIENRIDQGIPLQLDSTTNYATQTFDIRTTDEQRASDSPYNTYAVQGLPPAPIKNPGRQAIEAALSPTPGPWVYFVTVDLCTGETAFAETLDEHNANVRQLNEFQRENSVDGQLVCD
ncbi:endolytic transglycosylase MltG [Aquipuribacter sp. SD81]|uniref:endolytic transglycosylase MltG n=1 Tax=Aquipuribacter sp. SD81 TaxID=3127703 RepID=UPI003017FEBF